MAEIGTRTLRVKLDTSVALPSDLAIASWRGNALDLEVGIYDADGVASITNIQSINVKVQESQLSNTTLMDSTVAAGSMDATLDADSWTDGSKQHATFSFTDAQANLTITTTKQEYWIVFSCILTSGETVTLAAGSFTLHEDNDTTAGGDPDVNPGTAITLEEADARYATLAQGNLSEWQLKTADFTAEPNGRYLIDVTGLTATTAWTTDGDTCEFYSRDGFGLTITDTIVSDLIGDQESGSQLIRTSYDGSLFTNRVYVDQLVNAAQFATVAHTHSTEGDVALSALNIGGGTDIGTDLADDDLIIVDDGAGGTNRKSALSRVWTYIKSKIESIALTLTNVTVTDYTESVVATGTVTTTHTFSLTSGTVQTVQLTASTACTFTMPTATAGKSFTCFLKQAAATGNGTATFTGVVWSGGTAPTITATAGQMDIISFVADGTSWFGSIIQDFTA